MMKAKPKGEASTAVGEIIREEMTNIWLSLKQKMTTSEIQTEREKEQLAEFERKLTIKMYHATLFTDEDMLKYSMEQREKIEEQRIKTILKETLLDTEDEYQMKKNLFAGYKNKINQQKIERSNQEKIKEKKVEERREFLQKKHQALLAKQESSVTVQSLESKLADEKERRQQAEEARLKKIIELKRLRDLDFVIQLQKQRKLNTIANERRFREAMERLREQEQNEEHYNQLADDCLDYIEQEFISDGKFIFCSYIYFFVL